MPAKTPMTWIAEWLRVKSRSTNASTPAAGYAAFFAKSKAPYFINEDGTVTALAAGAGDVVGPASAVGDNVVTFNSTTGKLIKDSGKVILTLAAGTYLPTLSNTTNIAASTAATCQYLRVGDVVAVSGLVDIDPTTTGATTLGMTIPIASNFANATQLAGAASTLAQESARLMADTTNDRVLFSFSAVATTNQTWSFTFTYLVI